ncbi:MAG TPA: hypothetical protein PKZ76_10590 [Xanthomonadaceae bacterium]|nr:hypothetical protein [Xanthomonadaceae bacterium]
MRTLAAFLVLTLPASAMADADAFWANLSGHCGKAYEGIVLDAPEGDETFTGKRLVMHVRSCEEKRIRIPFMVGDDRSRTWVLTRVGDRIELKHDHRHEDGSDDEVTMYGGTSTNAGHAGRQVFPADEQTHKVIPYAAANVWMIEIEPGVHYTYSLRRMGTPRHFRARFDLSREVTAPEAPWGWKD